MGTQLGHCLWRVMHELRAEGQLDALQMEVLCDPTGRTAAATGWPEDKLRVRTEQKWDQLCSWAQAYPPPPVA